MARSLQEDFGVPVKWIEPASDDTAQNAEFSARILQEAGIRRVLLVTDALHMPRSRRIFERNGFDVVPAPTDFHTTADLRAMEWVPSGPALGLAHYALHEWLGLLWYRIRH